VARSERGIVTPEGVLLEFESAAVGSRMLAVFLDLFIQLNLLTPISILLGPAVSGAFPQWLAVVLLVIALFLVIFGYPIAMETLWNGRTIGKAALGLRVVTAEGTPVRFRHAAIRAALQIVDFFLLFGSVAVISSLVTRNNQRLGDLAAGTIVLRERKAESTTKPVTFPVPAGWEAYAASLDVSRVTPAQYGLVRDFLLRVTELRPAARLHIGQRLARPLASSINHQPPPGTATEGFLVCTVARYQLRHAGPDVVPVVTSSPPPSGPRRAPAPEPPPIDSAPPDTGPFIPPD
jgi:uncharacterized RDD family membrane protein YckC